jgi:hypothetical protein
MPDERNDDGWIGQLLSTHANRRELDLHAFMTRIMTEANASQANPVETPARPSLPIGPRQAWRRDPDPASASVHLQVRNRPTRRRLMPALIAAASVLTVAVTGSAVSALAHWTAPGDRAAVARPPSPSPNPNPNPNPNHSVTSGGNPPSLSATPSAATRTGAAGSEKLPTSFRWSSGAPLISPRSDTDRGLVGMKDPTVVRYGGKWHVFTTTVSASGYGLGYLSFTDWSEASSARLYHLDASPMGAGFRAAPQVFYFAPQKLWYLVYQTGNASYSTNPDINDPKGWSAPKDFYSAVPDLIRKNLASGFWLDMWVICDETDCYLFSSDNHGHLFRSQTPKASFPNGMSQPVIAAQDSGQGTSFAASQVYQVAGTGQYLLLSLAWDGEGRGYFRSWTSGRVTGPWTPLADTPAAPFAGASNITFTGSPWTRKVVHGELIRDGYDQTLTVSPCHLRFLYLGLDPDFSGNRSLEIGLLTQTNSTCS